MNTDFSHITDIEGMRFINEEDALNKLINEIHPIRVFENNYVKLELDFSP
ncbi:phosphoribosyltransferase, partial [Helicobacter pylori]|nr:phosphoribosyltransferase [Helicobacter pylori]